MIGLIKLVAVLAGLASGLVVAVVYAWRRLDEGSSLD